MTLHLHCVHNKIAHINHNPLMSFNIEQYFFTAIWKIKIPNSVQKGHVTKTLPKYQKSQ